MKYYLGMYDIGCDKVRYRVRKVLLAYGIHQQKSVFECRLTPLQRAELIAQLDVMVQNVQARILFIQIYPNHPQTEFFGQARKKLHSDCLYIG